MWWSAESKPYTWYHELTPHIFSKKKWDTKLSPIVRPKGTSHWNSICSIIDYRVTNQQKILLNTNRLKSCSKLLESFLPSRPWPFVQEKAFIFKALLMSIWFYLGMFRDNESLFRVPMDENNQERISWLPGRLL